MKVTNDQVERTVQALESLAKNIGRCADEICRLGNNDANTRMGALEALGAGIQDSISELTPAIQNKK